MKNLLISFFSLFIRDRGKLHKTPFTSMRGMNFEVKSVSKYSAVIQTYSVFYPYSEHINEYTTYDLRLISRTLYTTTWEILQYKKDHYMSLVCWKDGIRYLQYNTRKTNEKN